MRTLVALIIALGGTFITLLMLVVLADTFILALVPVTGSWFLAALIAWGICVALFSAIGLFTVWVSPVLPIPNHPRPNIFESPSGFHGWSWPIPSTLDSQQMPTWMSDECPAYHTRVEILNEPSARDDSSSLTQPTFVAVTVLAESHSEYTFATSPFTSPPVFSMQIFVSREQVVNFDEDTPNRPNPISVTANGETAGAHVNTTA
ncbi:hypothetical protein FRC12_023439 [Ceratobasidium sp. 428]|nr:hypothetical protein FRC12_023439 [Ceratobasidium sp. 428]